MEKEKTNTNSQDLKKSNKKTIDSMTEQQKLSCKKFVGHYLDLFPITGSSLTTNETKKIEKLLDWKNLTFDDMSGKVMTFVSKNDSVKSCFVYILKKLPFLSSARYVSLYDILDIQFGNHPKYTSIRDVRAPIILVYAENVTNRLKDEYLLRAIDFWCKKGSTVWIFFKGLSSAEWISNFPKTRDFAVSNRLTSIDLIATSKARITTNPVQENTEE